MPQDSSPTPRSRICIQKQLLKLVTSMFLVAVLLLVNASPALAWKPTTHVYLGELALKDALDDGKVSIYRVDYDKGQVLSKVGDYAVDSNTLAALRAYPAQYRAGILGPDAYPDILTGQQVIHPGPQDTNIPGGSNAWLRYLWNLTSQPGNNSPQIKAFVVGYLTHAAGDMYGHTFVNNFSGGHFKITPPEGPENAVKHILVEGYIDKRAPSPTFNASIAGVEDFIYRNMIDARPGSTLDRELLRQGAGGTEASVPRIYSTIRARLQRDIDNYYATKSDYDRRINDKLRAARACKPLDFSCSARVLEAQAAAITVQKGAYVAANGLQTTYKEYWRDDIDRGLRAWPQTSDRVAKALFFNPEKKANVDEAERILKAYVTNHLISMSGAPDVAGQFVAIADKISTIIAQTIPDALVAPIRQLKDNIYDAVITGATGLTKQELQQYFSNPATYFDQVMTRGSGENLNLQTFNTKYLQIQDTGYTNPSEQFDYQKVPAAYNTATMSKLLLLSPNAVNQLLADLGSSTRLNQPNAMLGFIQTLDGDNEWSGQGQPPHPQTKMVAAQNCNTYKQLFMRQPGEVACT